MGGASGGGFPLQLPGPGEDRTGQEALQGSCLLLLSPLGPLLAPALPTAVLHGQWANNEQRVARTLRTRQACALYLAGTWRADGPQRQNRPISVGMPMCTVVAPRTLGVPFPSNSSSPPPTPKSSRQARLPSHPGTPPWMQPKTEKLARTPLTSRQEKNPLRQRPSQRDDQAAVSRRRRGGGAFRLRR